ncbi:40S ribosomal protein S15a-like [Sorex araneus]|uniref:40S ribosomal protein S15a-like n=1 Tax=Sorex araneus TaxID=42254 RepID=UPI002433BCB6|nr:40S ribosomal protein S15a-like [Sorex araneus]
MSGPRTEPYAKTKSGINSAEKRVECHVPTRPRSTVTARFLSVTMKRDFFDELEVKDDQRAGRHCACHKQGKQTECGVITLRCDVQLQDLEKWQSDLLLSHQFYFIY